MFLQGNKKWVRFVNNSVKTENNRIGVNNPLSSMKNRHKSPKNGLQSLMISADFEKILCPKP